MRSLISAPLLLVSALSAGLLLASVACDKEKSQVEKLADQLASSNSAARASVDAAPDPAELKYRERKVSLEQTVSSLKSDEAHVMAKDPVATPGILRHYFPDGPDGDRAASELEAKRKKDGEGGYRIHETKIVETRVTGTMEDAEIDVQEETVSKGNSACLLYSQSWKFLDGKWIFQKQLSVRKVDCQ